MVSFTEHGVLQVPSSDPDSKFVVEDPATREQVATLYAANAADVHKAVQVRPELPGCDVKSDAVCDKPVSVHHVSCLYQSGQRAFESGVWSRSDVRQRYQVSVNLAERAAVLIDVRQSCQVSVSLADRAGCVD